VPAIAAFLERSLEYRRRLFESLILGGVQAGLKYRQKNNNPITPDDIKTHNGLIAEVDFR